MIDFRKLVIAAEADVELVVALRRYPLKATFHHRKSADCFKVGWDMTKSAIEPSHAIDFQKLVIGAEADVERAVALRPHPLQVDFRQKNG